MIAAETPMRPNTEMKRCRVQLSLPTSTNFDNSIPLPEARPIRYAPSWQEPPTTSTIPAIMNRFNAPATPPIQLNFSITDHSRAPNTSHTKPRSQIVFTPKLLQCVDQLMQEDSKEDDEWEEIEDCFDLQDSVFGRDARIEFE